MGCIQDTILRNWGPFLKRCFGSPVHVYSEINHSLGNEICFWINVIRIAISEFRFQIYLTSNLDLNEISWNYFASFNCIQIAATKTLQSSLHWRGKIILKSYFRYYDIDNMQHTTGNFTYTNAAKKESLLSSVYSFQCINANTMS